MKLRTMLYGLTLMLGCFVLAACVNDEEGPCLPDGKTQVLFSLHLQDNAITRAEVDNTEQWKDYDPTETGVAYDNFIDLDNVQMLLFKDGVCKGKLGNMTHTKTGVNTYQYIGTAPPDLQPGDYKFVILANCQEVDPNGLTLQALGELAFDYYGDPATNVAYIPMWGTKDVYLTLKAGSRQDLEEIGLLRAMSKVTVALSGSDSDLNEYDVIQSVKVTRYNKSGYVVPTGYNTTVATTELYLEASLHENKTTFAEDEDKGRTFLGTSKELTFYLLEYDNSSEKAELIVTLAKTDDNGNISESKEFTGAPIQFCEYFTDEDTEGTPGIPDTSKPYNIVRNHYYQFNIFKVTDRSLYVLPTVLPWNLGDEFTYKTDVSAFYSTGQQYLRWDTDGNLDDWHGSYVAVTHEWEDESQVPGRTPLIILKTTSSEPMYMQLDNEYLEFVKQNTDGTFEELGVGKRMEIPSGVNITTHFFVRPVSAYDTAAEPLPSREAHMSLVSNGPAPARVPLRGSMPGYAEGVDEIWFYWVGPTDYKEYLNGTGPGGASSKFEN